MRASYDCIKASESSCTVTGEPSEFPDTWRQAAIGRFFFVIVATYEYRRVDGTAG